MIRIFVVLLMWYGDRCFITIVNTVIFHNQRGVVQHIFLSLIFLFKECGLPTSGI